MSIAPAVGPEANHVDEVALDGAVAVKGRTPWQIVRMRLVRDKVTMVALVGSAIFILIALTSPLMVKFGWIKPDVSNEDLVQSLGSMPTGPFGGASKEHWLGVEPGTGRDLLSRIMAGITTSMTVAVIATVIAVLLGTVVGIISGYSRGWLDQVFGRLNDLILSFPQTLMLISLSTILTERIASVIGVDSADNKAKIAYMALVLGLFGFPYLARIIRGQVLSLREREFIEAARSLGARQGRIYFKELLPHLWAPLLVFTSLALPANISAEAALGFLGVGIVPPTASFGAILNDSVTYALPDPAYFFFPGFALFLLVLSLNLLGDGLRDALDPKSGRS